MPALVAEGLVEHYDVHPPLPATPHPLLLGREDQLLGNLPRPKALGWGNLEPPKAAQMLRHHPDIIGHLGVCQFS